MMGQITKLTTTKTSALCSKKAAGKLPPLRGVVSYGPSAQSANRNALGTVTHVVLGTEEGRWEREDSGPVLTTSLSKVS